MSAWGANLSPRGIKGLLEMRSRVVELKISVVAGQYDAENKAMGGGSRGRERHPWEEMVEGGERMRC